MDKWNKADNYIGQDYPGFYVLLSQSRDSDILDQSNFTTALEQLGGESDTVIVIRSNHWAVGWVECIAIHESDKRSTGVGGNIQWRLKDYPILDEEDYYERENEYITDTWLNSYSLGERIGLCAEYDESIFASRGIEILSKSSGIYEHLKVYCGL